MPASNAVCDQNIGNEEGNPLVLPLYIHHVFLLFMYSLARIKDLLRVGYVGYKDHNGARG